MPSCAADCSRRRRATKEAAAHITRDRRFGTVYTARTGIDMEEDLLDDRCPKARSAWEHRLDARHVLRLLVPAGAYVYQPKQSGSVCQHDPPGTPRRRPGRFADGQGAGHQPQGLRRPWVTYYYQPADVMANRSNPLKSPATAASWASRNWK